MVNVFDIDNIMTVCGNCWLCNRQIYYVIPIGMFLKDQQHHGGLNKDFSVVIVRQLNAVTTKQSLLHYRDKSLVGRYFSFVSTLMCESF